VTSATRTDPISTSDYSPGDVVEFEREGETGKGIIFLPNTNTFVYVACVDNYHWPDEIVILKKIGFCEDIVEEHDILTAEAIAKSYFSKSDKVVFKVGDKVRVLDSNPHSYLENGKIYRVDRVDGPGSLRLFDKDNFAGYVSAKYLALASFAPNPDASYAENQKAWIEYYKIDEESRLKVVCKFERQEGGFDGTVWDCPDSKEAMQGKAYNVERIDSGHIVLYGNYFPYFALEPA